MNSTQRKFLVDKVTERTKAQIQILRDTIPESLNLNVYMLHRVMSNDFEIKSQEELRKVVLDKAIKAGKEKQHREDWLGNTWGSASRKNVAFELDEFFVIPEEYLKMREDREEEKRKVEEQIRLLQIQLETLEIRIMVASDKALQKLINEVDDMGDINLIDTKIKLLD